ncbi:MAG: hypothetical protein HYR48_02780 [Gemmatimonadetes bacterium]|nr:hypothetical protein [Gemmatimonadota bacterium]
MIMPMCVRLREIVDGMESQSDEMTAYLNVKTGQVVPVSDEELAAAEAGEQASDQADWEAEALEIARGVLAGEDYIALPDRVEIDEYRMMDRFASTVPDPAASARLQRAIQGRGAFRYFKDSIHDLGLAEEWYSYRDRGYEEIAVAWCEAHGIEYTRNQPARQADA